MSPPSIHRQAIPAGPRLDYWSGIRCPNDHHCRKAHQVADMGYGTPPPLLSHTRASSSQELQGFVAESFHRQAAENRQRSFEETAASVSEFEPVSLHDGIMALTGHH